MISSSFLYIALDVDELNLLILHFPFIYPSNCLNIQMLMAMTNLFFSLDSSPVAKLYDCERDARA